MPFNLYTDRDEVFECSVSVRNASLKNSIARLLIESDSVNLVFNGKIENGKCKVPIKRLGQLLEENSKGKIKLEIIVENTYFSPWEDDFEVEKHTRVEINEVKSSVSSSPEVKVVVNNNNKKGTYKQSLTELIDIFNKLGINKKSFKKNPKGVAKFLKEYLMSNKGIFSSDRKNIVKDIISNLR